MFEMSNETCLNMNEVFPLTSHLQIQQLTWQLTFVVDRWLGHAQMILSLNLLMKWHQNETLAYTSSTKSYDDLHLIKDIISLKIPDWHNVTD